MISFFISTFNYLRFIFKVKENSTIIFFSESKYYIDHFEDLVLEIKKIIMILFILQLIV